MAEKFQYQKTSYLQRKQTGKSTDDLQSSATLRLYGTFLG